MERRSYGGIPCVNRRRFLKGALAVTIAGIGDSKAQTRNSAEAWKEYCAGRAGSEKTTTVTSGTNATQPIEVVYAAQPPLSELQPPFSGFKQEKTILPKGYTFQPGRMPFPCETVYDRDVAIRLRDGVTIFADIYRPAGEEKVPAVLAWGSYGKHGHNNLLDNIGDLLTRSDGVKLPARMGVPRDGTSGMQAWESPDPAHWVPNGYALVNVDPRGAYLSGGDMQFFGPQDAQDGYDAIEWLARQEWCNGKVGMNGNSWYGMTQWEIAAVGPPHLAAISPWEAETNIYRDEYVRDGIPVEVMTGLHRSYGANRVEDIAAMIEKYPLMNAYWESKVAKLDKIKIPAYIVASYNSQIHVRGTFEAFTQISSKEKWLRVHSTQEWPDMYDPKNLADLRRFFDRYLKGIDNGWEKTPRVRLSILDPGGTDIVGRAESEFPLARQKAVKLYLNAASRKLEEGPAQSESNAAYSADAGDGKIAFTIRFDKPTAIMGFIKLRLWVEADGAGDMDLFARIIKLDAKGKPLFQDSIIYAYSGPDGRIRVSHRQLDPEKSTPLQPVHTHKVEEFLCPGQIVPVEIQIWPTGLLFHPRQQLQLVVAGFDYMLSKPGDRPTPKACNKGNHIIHTGGKYDSHLLIPVIPSAS
jgi:uncharacterized protein